MGKNKTYYQTKYEVMNATLEDKIKTCLYLNAKSCEQYAVETIKNKTFSQENIKERNIRIGALVEGEAYFHEKDEYYDVVGFMVESESAFQGNRYKTYGFRGIYFSNCDEYAPIDFDDGVSLKPEGTIPNGLGDFVEIIDVLSTEEEVNEIIESKNIDINLYLKRSNLLLQEQKENIKKNKDIER